MGTVREGRLFIRQKSSAQSTTVLNDPAHEAARHRLKTQYAREGRYTIWGSPHPNARSPTYDMGSASWLILGDRRGRSGSHRKRRAFGPAK